MSYLACAGETFTVPPFQQVVRTLSLREGDNVVGSFSVSGGSGNDINFYITDPSGLTILRLDRVTYTSFSFSGGISGPYTMHFDNSFSWVSSKSVTLDYSVKTLIFGMPQDTFFVLIGLIIVIAVILVVFAILRMRKANTSSSSTSTQDSRAQ